MISEPEAVLSPPSSLMMIELQLKLCMKRRAKLPQGQATCLARVSSRHSCRVLTPAPLVTKSVFKFGFDDELHNTDVMLAISRNTDVLLCFLVCDFVDKSRSLVPRPEEAAQMRIYRQESKHVHRKHSERKCRSGDDRYDGSGWRNTGFRSSTMRPIDNDWEEERQLALALQLKVIRKRSMRRWIKERHQFWPNLPSVERLKVEEWEAGRDVTLQKQGWESQKRVSLYYQAKRTKWLQIAGKLISPKEVKEEDEYPSMPDMQPAWAAPQRLRGGGVEICLTRLQQLRVALDDTFSVHWIGTDGRSSKFSVAGCLMDTFLIAPMILSICHVVSEWLVGMPLLLLYKTVVLPVAMLWMEPGAVLASATVSTCGIRLIACAVFGALSGLSFARLADARLAFFHRPGRLLPSIYAVSQHLYGYYEYLTSIEDPVFRRLEALHIFSCQIPAAILFIWIAIKGSSPAEPHLQVFPVAPSSLNGPFPPQKQPFTPGLTAAPALGSNSLTRAPLSLSSRSGQLRSSEAIRPMPASAAYRRTLLSECLPGVESQGHLPSTKGFTHDSKALMLLLQETFFGWFSRARAIMVALSGELASCGLPLHVSGEDSASKPLTPASIAGNSCNPDLDSVTLTASAEYCAALQKTSRHCRSGVEKGDSGTELPEKNKAEYRSLDNNSSRASVVPVSASDLVDNALPVIETQIKSLSSPSRLPVPRQVNVGADLRHSDGAAQERHRTRGVGTESDVLLVQQLTSSSLDNAPAARALTQSPAGTPLEDATVSATASVESIPVSNLHSFHFSGAVILEAGLATAVEEKKPAEVSGEVKGNNQKSTLALGVDFGSNLSSSSVDAVNVERNENHRLANDTKASQPSVTVRKDPASAEKCVIEATGTGLQTAEEAVMPVSAANARKEDGELADLRENIQSQTVLADGGQSAPVRLLGAEKDLSVKEMKASLETVLPADEGGAECGQLLARQKCYGEEGCFDGNDERMALARWDRWHSWVRSLVSMCFDLS